MNTVFLRVLEADNKATALLDAVRGPQPRSGDERYNVDPSTLAVIPGSPFAYWLSHAMRKVFSQFPPVESGERRVRQGLGTANDFRFVRLWWEVNRKPTGKWFTFVRGGRTSAFYGEVDSILNWCTDGCELKAWATISTGGDHWSKNIRSTDLYFKPGLTWPLRAPRFAPYPIPSGSIFSIRGYAYVAPRDELLATLSLFSSRAFDYLFKALLGRHDYPEFIVGVLQKLPLPEAAPAALAELSGRSWSLKRSLDTHTETSHAFTLPVLLQVAVSNLAARATKWSDHVLAVESELAGIQAEIDDRCLVLYGIDDADRRAITVGFGATGAESVPSSDGQYAGDDAGEDADTSEPTADATGLATELACWTVGVAFGRFDVRLATSTRPMPTEPEPFDPLPACSPGMLSGDDGLPLARPPAGYPLAFPEIGVMVDDPGHSLDLTTAVRAVFYVAFGPDADRWWNDVAARLDPKGLDFRSWLASSFFEYHLKRYSKSRRKAPIFWQIATSSSSYAVWLYAHRLSNDTFFQVQNDFVAEKLRHEEREHAALVEAAGPNPSAADRKRIAAHEAFLDELRAMLDDVKRVAPLWMPNLDDGVVLTMAPLWRLVPQHRSWQRELKGRWDELCAGEHDWAHVAMHLWPERVVPKCATDRSLAIAHDLEDVFWAAGTDGKWSPRPAPTRSVHELVRERTSPAVKAALKSLLEAPTASGGSERRRRTATTSAGEGVR